MELHGTSRVGVFCLPCSFQSTSTLVFSLVSGRHLAKSIVRDCRKSVLRDGWSGSEWDPTFQLSNSLTCPRQYLQESLGQEAANKAAAGGIAGGEKIGMLEGGAGESTLQGHGTPEERFWQRQQGAEETIAIGKNYIAKVSICLFKASFG